MENAHIINIRGLMTGHEDDPIEAALRSHPKPPKSIITISPTPLRQAREDPEVAFQRCVSELRAAVKSILEKDATAKILLVGKSNGGFTGLRAAVCLKFENIAKSIPIDAPLNPHVAVPTPSLFNPLRLYSKHYEQREYSALELTRAVDAGFRDKIVMVQSLAPDAMVPNASQVLPGKYERVTYGQDESSQRELRTKCGTRGLVVQLDDSYAGTRSGFAARLPEAYTNHLSWSDRKMDAVVDIIRIVGETV